MKINKKALIVTVSVAAAVIAGVAVFFVVKGNNGENGAQPGQEGVVNGNCSVLDCLKQLDSKMDIAEMNRIMGFEGELVTDEEAYKIFSWKLTEDTSIRAQFMTNYDTATISAEYPSSMVPKTADFSRWAEIQSRLSDGEAITYDEFVEMVGGVEGVIKQKTGSNVSYDWENDEGGYLSGYFDYDGKCTMATGRF